MLLRLYASQPNCSHLVKKRQQVDISAAHHAQNISSDLK
jgi:hypothetical protein